jgi:Domain of unknown function (DUF6089)
MKKGLHQCLLKMFAAVALVVSTSYNADAQVKYEIGLNVGPSNFLGDLGGTQGRGQTFLKDNNWEMTRLVKGLTFTILPNEVVNFRFAMNFGRLEGADSVIDGKGGLEEARYYRNQHFRSKLFEAYAAAEVYPLVFLEDDPDDLMFKFRPYALIGVGVFRFNPEGQYINPNGEAQWVNLKPLRTEGQGMPNHPDRKEYSLTQVNVPYGIGLKYFFNDRFNLSVEIVNRITFTDYIDDVSTTYIAPQDFYNYFGNTPEADMAVSTGPVIIPATKGVLQPTMTHTMPPHSSWPTGSEAMAWAGM